MYADEDKYCFMHTRLGDLGGVHKIKRHKNQAAFDRAVLNQVRWIEDDVDDNAPVFLTATTSEEQDVERAYLKAQGWKTHRAAQKIRIHVISGKKLFKYLRENKVEVKEGKSVFA